MPKIVDYNLRKQQIMREAIHVFIEEGYHKTKLHQIAERCNLGRTTIYKYFKDKNEIFYYAVNDIFSLLENDYQRIANQPHLSQVDKIEAYIAKLLEDCYQKKNFMLLLIDLWLRLKRENCEVVNKVKERAHEIRLVFEKLLQEGIEKQEIRPLNVQSMSFTLFSLVESLILQISFAEEMTPVKSLKSVNILLNGLRA